MPKLNRHDIFVGPIYLGDGLWECITDSRERFYVEGPNEDGALREFDAGNHKNLTDYKTLFSPFPA